MAEMRMKVNLTSVNTTLRKLGVDKNGRIQRYVTDEILRRMIDYIPMQSGYLRARAEAVNACRIKVNAPYARKQFFGVTKDGRPYNYDLTHGAKIGSHWDRRLMQDEGRAIVADVNRYVRSG